MKILWRTLLTFFLVAYVAVALVNFSLVQSLVGSVASNHFSKEWGGKVRVGSVGFNPFYHLVLHRVELISPEGDTICNAVKIAMRFNKFPISQNGITADYVLLKDVYYHLKIDSSGTNLQYIFDYFSNDTTDSEPDVQHPPFVVMIDEVQLDNITYRQDLHERHHSTMDSIWPWVNIKHMEYRHINGRFRNVRVDEGDVTCRIDRFSTNEKCGLQVNMLQGNVYATRSGISVTNMTLETNDSKLMGDVLLDYHSWESMDHFLDSVFFTVHFDHGSYGGMRDAAYWAYALWGMDERVYISGDFYGPIANFHSDNVRLAFGKESRIDLDASIKGLPHINNTVIEADIHNLHTSYADLAAVRHPGGTVMKAEKIVKALDVFDIQASFMGTVFDFNSSVALQSPRGDLNGSLSMAMQPEKKYYKYSGSVASSGFQVGALAPNEWVSRSGFDFSFDGNGFDPRTMNATLEGRLHHTVLRGQRLMGETAVDAYAKNDTISAELSLDDAIGKVLAHCKMHWRNDLPVVSANLDADRIDMKRLGLWHDTNDHQALLSLQARGLYSSLKDGAFAGISLNNVSLLSTTRNCRLKKLNASMNESNYWKELKVNSELVSGQLHGYFDWRGVGMLFSKFVDDYIPTLNGHNFAVPEAKNYERIADARFDMNLQWHDSSNLLHILLPQLMVAKNTSLQVNYNYGESFKPALRSDSLKWNNMAIYNIVMSGEAVADRYQIRVNCDEMTVGNLVLSDKVNVKVETSSSGGSCHLWWENGSDAIGDGDMALRMVVDSGMMRFFVDPSHLYLAGHQWRLNPNGMAMIGPEGWWIDGISLESDGQRLSLAASRQGLPGDSLVVALADFDLGVVNPFLGISGMSASGIANGNVSVGGLADVPYLNADVNVDGLAFDGVALGNARLRSTWNAELNQLNLHMTSGRDDPNLPDIFLAGYATLENDDTQLDFTASLEEVDLQIISPFVNSFSSDVGGLVSADIDIGGSLNAPVVVGDVYLDHARLKVDFLNVAFSASDTVTLTENAILLDSMAVSDQNGGVALLNGVIHHDHLKDMTLDINVASERLLCMNTTFKQSPEYYGSVVAALNGSVSGPVDDIDVVLNATTLEGSALHIPINDSRRSQQASYIHFASEHDDPFMDFAFGINPGGNDEPHEFIAPVPARQNEHSSNQFHLTVNVSTTPEMQMHLPVEFSTISADISARGGGDLQLAVGSDNPFSIIGDYEMESGSLKLQALDVLSKDFTIGQGSNINFPGSISDAIFDIRAVFSQRVNLSTLTGSLSSNDSQIPVQVENIISLSGTMQAPDIKFDIELPNADQTVQEEVFAYIDRNNERDMLNQTVSLLLLKKFYSASSSVDQGTAAATEGSYGLVANTLGSMVNDMVNFVDINFEYQAGTAQTTDQYMMDISKEWKRFYFETTLGFGGEARELSGTNGSNNMTGDMLVGYKINPRFHLFVFNRSNTNDYSRSDLPYKQGIGVKYTRDFDKFSELFKRKK